MTPDSPASSGGLGAQVAGWAPEPVEMIDRLGPWPVEAFAAMLDMASPIAAAGDPIPPLWHWFYFLEHPARAGLGADGHPAHGHFLPPIPDRRRLFAGGRLAVREPLRVGEQVRRRSALVAMTPKQGRSGEMLFVTVRHEFFVDGEVAVVEEQDIVYRSQPASVARPVRGATSSSGTPAGPDVATEPAVQDVPAASADPEQIRLDPDEALLFRFSALTYNTHRIHYDQAYATGVEGYPGLVVHGPLLALLLLELERRDAPDRPVRQFSFRLERPAFAGVPVFARRQLDGQLVAGPSDGLPAIRGHLDVVPR